MSRESGWHDVHEGTDCPCGRACGDLEAVLAALADRIYPISTGDRHADVHRYFGADLHRLSDSDLDLDEARVTFRLCLEAKGPDRWWLLSRLERIREEQACRERPQPRVVVAAPVAQGMDQEEREREAERRHHEEWLRWSATQRGAA